MLFETLKEWAFQLVNSYGQIGLFVIAFAESSFFPIPPDVLVIALVMPPTDASPFITATICTVGSVAGAVGGWLIGKWGGRPILDKLFDPEKVRQVEKLYDRYGVAAVFIAAFTPIPYKVFTIASGVFRLNLLGFIGASVIGRGARFFLVAYLTDWFGEWVVKRLDKVMIIALVLLAIAATIYWFVRARKNKALKSSAESPQN